jgi:hypothetical protein
MVKKFMNHNFEALCSTLAYGYDPAKVPKIQNRDDGILLIGNFILLIKNQINRKLRVATKIGSTFFWFLTCYWAAEKLKNDNLSSA